MCYQVDGRYSSIFTSDITTLSKGLYLNNTGNTSMTWARAAEKLQCQSKLSGRSQTFNIPPFNFNSLCPFPPKHTYLRAVLQPSYASLCSHGHSALTVCKIYFLTKPLYHKLQQQRASCLPLVSFLRIDITYFIWKQETKRKGE